MLDFADQHLRAMKVERRFDEFPSDSDMVSEGVFNQHLRGLPVERRFDEFPSDTVSGAVFNVRELGAVGDGKTKDPVAIQAALDRCAAAGGGIVVVPAGDYLTGSLDVKSQTTLRIEKDATLLGSPRS